MKRFLQLIFVLLLFTACAASPEKVAKKTSAAIATGDFETAKKHSTEAAGQLLDLIASQIDAEDLKGADTTFDYIRTEENEAGDEATVYYLNGDGEEGEVDLVKEDGKWLVDISFFK